MLERYFEISNFYGKGEPDGWHIWAGIELNGAEKLHGITQAPHKAPCPVNAGAFVSAASSRQPSKIIEDCKEILRQIKYDRKAG